MTENYDVIYKLVNNKIAKLGDSGIFSNLKTIYKKLKLPTKTSFETDKYPDYFEFMDDD